MIMRKEALPHIRSADSAGIPQALQCLTGIATYAQEKGKYMLAFVTGVPGAGKTYLGLQYVYESLQAAEQVHSVYLSGNGPLVKVLSSPWGAMYLSRTSINRSMNLSAIRPRISTKTSLSLMRGSGLGHRNAWPSGTLVANAPRQN